VQKFPLLLVERGQGQHFQHAQHAGQRGADFVTHRGEEGILGAVGQLRLLLGSDQLLLRLLAGGNVPEQKADPLFCCFADTKSEHVEMAL